MQRAAMSVPASAEREYEDFLERGGAERNLLRENRNIIDGGNDDRVVSPILGGENPIPVTFQYEESRHLLLHHIDWYGPKIGKLGEGGYGVVSEYKIPDNDEPIDVSGNGTVYGRSVAIKFGAEDSISEIAYLVRVKHPNILNIIDGGWSEDEQKFFCVLPLAKNTLAKILYGDAGILYGNDIGKDPKIFKLDLQTRLRFVYELMNGVSYCLQRDIVHRDLKSENILIMEDGTLKIADLGLTTALECIETEAMVSNVYSLWYRPPEILMGGHYDLTADIWAMGCIVYEIFKTTQVPVITDGGDLTHLALFPGKEENPPSMVRLITDALGPILSATWEGAKNLPGWMPNYEMIDRDWFIKESRSQEGLYYYTQLSTGESQFERPPNAGVISFPLYQRMNRMPEIIQDIITQCVAYPPARVGVSALGNFINQVGEEIGMVPRRFTALPTCEQALDMRCNPNVEYKGPGLRRNFVHLVKRTPHLASYIVATEDLRSDSSINAAINIATHFCEGRYDTTRYLVHCSKEERGDILAEMGYDLVVTLPYDYLVLFYEYYTHNTKGIAMSILTRVLLSLHAIRGGARDVAVACLMIACTFTEEKFKHVTKITRETMRVQEMILSIFSSDEGNLFKARDKTMVTGIDLVERLRGKALLT